MHFVYVEADGSIKMSKSQFSQIVSDAYQDGYEKGKKECEATHNTIYDDGYKAGYVKGTTVGDKAIYPGKDSHEFYWSITNPNPNLITPTITCACEDDKCTCDNEKNHSKTVKTNIPAIHATYTVTPKEAQEISKRVSDLFSANSVNDVFTNLKKELGL